MEKAPLTDHDVQPKHFSNVCAISTWTSTCCENGTWREESATCCANGICCESATCCGNENGNG